MRGELHRRTLFLAWVATVGTLIGVGACSRRAAEQLERSRERARPAAAVTVTQEHLDYMRDRIQTAEAEVEACRAAKAPGASPVPWALDVPVVLEGPAGQNECVQPTPRPCARRTRPAVSDSAAEDLFGRWRQAERKCRP